MNVMILLNQHMDRWRTNIMSAYQKIMVGFTILNTGLLYTVLLVV